MATKLDTTKLINYLVTVFEDEKKTEEYLTRNYFNIFGGWCGTMSPETRPALIRVLGVEAVNDAEAAARAIIAEKQNTYQQSNYFKHLTAANEWKAAGGAAPTQEGQFIYMVTSGLKFESGIYGELLQAFKDPRGAELVKVEKVIKVEDLTQCDFDELVKLHGLKGGGDSDDIAEDVKGWELTEEQRKTIYINVAIVVDNSGRWLGIDSEGYEYARYCYLPENYSEVFFNELNKAIEDNNRREAAEKEQHQNELNEHKSAYNARLEELRQMYNFMMEQPQTTQQARKNMLLWLKHHFPGVNFKISVHQHTHYYELCDFGLDIEAPENTPEDVRSKFDELWQNTWGEALPEGEEGNITHSEYDGPSYTSFEEYRSTPMERLFKSYEFWHIHYTLPAQDFDAIKVAPAELPAVEPAPTEPAAAPIEIKGNFQIIDYSEKAIAVIGDTKAIKGQLKSLGGRFNPKLNCGAGWIFSKRKEVELKNLLNA